jgi:hypothetical protein
MTLVLVKTADQIKPLLSSICVFPQNKQNRDEIQGLARKCQWRNSNIINFKLHGITATKPVAPYPTKYMQIMPIAGISYRLTKWCAACLKRNRIQGTAAIIQPARQMRACLANKFCRFDSAVWNNKSRLGIAAAKRAKPVEPIGKIGLASGNT